MKPTYVSPPIFDYGIRGPYWLAGYHTGRDYKVGDGTRLRATRKGTVVFVGVHGGWGSSYGLHVIIKTGLIRHAYCHMSHAAVKVGQTVYEGQYIGLSGRSGNVTGPHCHYEERYYPFGYWQHRKPTYDRTQGIPTIDASAIAVSMKASSVYGNGRVYKRELAAALKAAGIKPVSMNTASSRLGKGAKENTRKLQRKWYKEDGGGIPGYRLLTKLGNRRHAWLTVH